MSLATRLTRALLSVTLLGIGTPAFAQTVTQTLSNTLGGSVSVTSGLGGWQIQINGCILKTQGINGACYTSSTLGEEVVITATSGSLSLVFQNVPGQTSPNSLMNSGFGLGISDLNYTLIVTAPGSQLIWYASDALAGSVTLNDTTGKNDVTTSLGSYSGLTVSLATTPGVTGTILANSFSGIQDTKINPTTAPAGDTAMVLTSVTDTFKVPEPVSITLFAVGLAGLGVMRRRRPAQPDDPST